MSRILAEYGLDVWIWFPLLRGNPDDPKWFADSARDWDEVFARLPRIDAVFVPGGDPGEMQPKRLMAHLEKQAQALRRRHPRAQMWVSPQNFDSASASEYVRRIIFIGGFKYQSSATAESVPTAFINDSAYTAIWIS